ncbi:esterase/lipase family protein [Streptomyces sp. NPDC060027]|uniref:esterase/lipase family protein n=1 Tax=Streptomyces sp. NPDC060027 TaxID=3347040 RepID=UPI0036BE545F
MGIFYSLLGSDANLRISRARRVPKSRQLENFLRFTRPLSSRSWARSLLASAAASLILTVGFAQNSAHADPLYPVPTAQKLADPNVKGANDWWCKPNAAHPRPIVLVHGTFTAASAVWNTLSPELKNQGYCVFALNYGEKSGVPLLKGIAPVAGSARQLSDFVDGVLAATGAKKVDMVGHSQGAMMPRYYLKYLNGKEKVNSLIGLGPTNHGTTIDGIATLAARIPGAADVYRSLCPACSEQLAGSSFLEDLNAGGDVVPGVSYTVIATQYDAVATPYQKQFLTGANVRNVVLQDLCAADFTGHAALTFDRIALHEVRNALDPANASPSTCWTAVTG